MFEGKKTTDDFLSLYDDSRLLSQGFNLKTHDFLKPLEKADEAGVVTVATSAEGRAGVAHVLPGGIGTYSISRACGSGSAAAVKPEPDSGRGGHGSYAGAGFTLWEGKDIGNGSGGKITGAQWLSPLAASTSTSFASHSSSRNRLSRDKKRIMESGSRSSRGFDEEDEDDDEFCKREGTSKKRELSVKVDGKSGNEQRGPTTPRSKHSATEQRRRSKINDRFQILRELIPHSDQKRDKASFLLEVIEYIQFLQERVQKYESSYPGFTEENAKLMPWNTNQVPADVAADPSQVIRNVPSPGFIYSADDNNVPPVPGVLSTAQNPIDSDTSAGVSYKSLENHVGFASKATVASFPPQRLISHIDNLASHSQSQWLRPSDYSVSSDVISEPEELTVDEGTINVSAAYSQNILNTLNQALGSSGIDLSQASISVQINLGKRATRRATTTMSSAKDFDDPSAGNRPVIEHSRAGSSGEELEQAPKRHKSENI